MYNKIIYINLYIDLYFQEYKYMQINLIVIV